MTITITSPTTGVGNLQGPGGNIAGTISGPTLLDDFMIADLETAAPGGNFACVSNRLVLLGHNTWILTWTTVGDTSIGFVPDGTIVTCTVQAFHSNNVQFDVVHVLTAYKYTSTGGLANLIVGGTGSSVSTQLAAIQASLSTTYLNQP